MNKSGYYSTYHTLAIKITLLFLAMGCCKSISPALAESSLTLQPNTPAETWVLKQVRSGQLADLKERFPDNESDRVLSADFLESLLTTSFKDMKPQCQVIQIKHAVIVEPLNLGETHIPCYIYLTNCSFQNVLSFSGAVFQKGVSFEGSSFSKAHFDVMEVKDSAIFSRTIFNGLVSFKGAEIGRQFNAEEAKFTNAKEKVSFDSMKTGHSAIFRKAIFDGGVNFAAMEIGNQLKVDGARFTNTEEEVYFNGTKAESGAFFRKVVFMGPVGFNGMDVRDRFFADEAKFVNPEQKVGFELLRVHGTMSICKAVFEGSANFSNMEVDGQFGAEEARFNNDKQLVSFNGMRTGGLAIFRETIFAGPVDFTGTQIGSQFIVEKAQFTNVDTGVSFSIMRTEDLAIFKKAVFAGPVQFRMANFGGQFIAEEAQFTNVKEPVLFVGMKVESDVVLRKAVFAGPTMFNGMEVNGYLAAMDAHFNNTQQGVDFSMVKVRGSALFSKTIFAGPVSFEGAEVDGQFVAEEVRFTNNEHEASFVGMRTRDSAIFRKAVFKGAVDFSSADIGGYFDADEAQFTNAKQKACFSSMRVENSTFFRNTNFAGPVMLNNGIFLDLYLQDSKDKSSTWPFLDLSQSLIKRKLQINGLGFNKLNAIYLDVKGRSLLSQLTINEMANFEHSSFQTLRIQNISWPKDLKPFQLDGMTYQHIESTSWEELLRLVDSSKYNAQTYKNLENFFQRQRDSDRADEVYISQRRRERREFKLSRCSLYKNLFWDGFIRYGRRPLLAFRPISVLVFIGCIIFRRKYMELQRHISLERNSFRYNPFWYSLDLFLPFIDLQMKKFWTPKLERSAFVHFYMRIHIIAGWLLIPIGLWDLTRIIS